MSRVVSRVGSLGGDHTPEWRSPDLPAPTMLTGTGKSLGTGWIETKEAAPVRPSTDKPPYRIPLMAEMAAIPWNGYKVASTFSGGGGSCLGYRWAGYKVVYANEFVAESRATYSANFPGTYLDPSDIRDVTGEQLLERAGVEHGQLDLLDGSPPCQSFSMAGKRERGWGQSQAHGDGSVQVSDDLFFEFARLLRDVQPKTFVAENVSGLVKGAAKGYFKLILAALKEAGYRVDARLLDAQWLGVPQARQRLIFVGVRNDLGLAPVHATPLPYRYSVRDALPELTGKPVNESITYQYTENSVIRSTPFDEPALTVTAHGMSGVNPGDALVPGDPAAKDPETGAALRGTRRRHDNSVVTRNGAELRINSLDEPSSTVLTRGIGKGSYGGTTVPGDPTAKDPETGASLRGHQRQHDNSITYQYGPKAVVRSSLFDEPSGTVMARGMGGVRLLQATVPGDPTARDPETGQSLSPIPSRLRPGAYGVRDIDLASPVPTICASGENDTMLGPINARRKFTIAELRRICGFPDDFVLVGSYGQRWARLGNAVPPPMMRAIAAAVRTGVLDKLPADTATPHEVP